MERVALQLFIIISQVLQNLDVVFKRSTSLLNLSLTTESRIASSFLQHDQNADAGVCDDARDRLRLAK
jgi:hypothetical protein